MGAKGSNGWPTVPAHAIFLEVRPHVCVYVCVIDTSVKDFEELVGSHLPPRFYEAFVTRAFTHRVVSPAYLVFLRQGFSMTWYTLIRLVWLATESQASSCLCLPSSEITSTCHHTWLFHVGSGDKNLGPDACVKRALPPSYLPIPSYWGGAGVDVLDTIMLLRYPSALR